MCLLSKKQGSCADASLWAMGSAREGVELKRCRNEGMRMGRRRERKDGREEEERDKEGNSRRTNKKKCDALSLPSTHPHPWGPPCTTRGPSHALAFYISLTVHLELTPPSRSSRPCPRCPSASDASPSRPRSMHRLHLVHGPGAVSLASCRRQRDRPQTDAL